MQKGKQYLHFLGGYINLQQGEGICIKKLAQILKNSIITYK